jgi:hypothetical protein
LSSLDAALFTVINTNDSGSGSLRKRIQDTNARPGEDVIVFAITNPSLTILLSSPLPAITDPVIIDGSSQPGYSGVPLVELNGANAGAGVVDGLNITTSNCVIRALVINRFSGNGIQIATNGFNTIEGCYLGLSATGTADQGNNLSGVFITNSANNTIGGIFATQRNYIAGNSQHGILIGGTAAISNRVFGNVIGLGVNDADLGNSGDGIRLAAPGNILGGTNAGARNIIAGNTSDGIEINGAAASNNIVQGNLIGADPTGTLDRGNGADGIYVTGASANTLGGGAAGAGNRIVFNGDGIEITGLGSSLNRVLGNAIGTDASGLLTQPNGGAGLNISAHARTNFIGGPGPGEANRIAGNVGDGVSVASGTNNMIRGNAIGNNTGLGIDLGANGVQANDNGDPDSGANQLQNYPVLTAATNTTTHVIVVGTLNSRPGLTYQVDFYSNLSPDESGNGEGQAFLGTTNFTTEANSNASFTAAIPAALAGRYVSSTATDPLGNTSEFSRTIRAVSLIPPATLMVTTTNEAGPGSLRQAILDSNNRYHFGTNRVHFNLPGSGPHTITPLSALPVIVEPVAIDGYTQPGAQTNTAASGFNGQGLIRLDGLDAGGGVDGLQIAAGGCLVRGLMITRFAGNGIAILGGTSNRVEGCVIGLDAAGLDQGNDGNGIYLGAAAYNTLGGLTLAARNVISGNTGDGIEISGAAATGNQVLGNFIGTGLTGTTDVGNTASGIYLTSARTNTIGDPAPTGRNIISGNNRAGVSIAASAASGNRILGNYLGTDVSGTIAVGNGDGIVFTGGTGNVVGGNAPGAGNLISGNDGDGVSFSGSATVGNQVLGNRIGVASTGAPLGQGTHGVVLLSATHDNVIGGVVTGAANTIAFNGGDGVFVNSGTNNSIRGNAIYDNRELGIDLGSTGGVTTNDVNDTDAGPNQLQNFPMLTSVTNSANTVVIAGSLHSRSSTLHQLDFYASATNDPSGFGEGNFYLGSSSVTTDGAGNGSFSVSLPVALPASRVCATATDPFGNTSEFGPGVLSFSSAGPSLTIAAQGSGFMLTWPSSAAGFQLQTTTNLTPTIYWTPVTNAISDNGTRKSVLLQPKPGEPTRFYRLKK